MTQNPNGKKLKPSVSSTWASSSSNQSVLPVSYPYKHTLLRINLSGFQLVQSKAKSPYKARPHRNHFHPLTSLTHASHKGRLFLSPFSDKSTLMSGDIFYSRHSALEAFPSSFWDDLWFHVAYRLPHQQWAYKANMFTYSCVSWWSLTGGHWPLF